jgi:serine/threonine-protein kinase
MELMDYTLENYIKIHNQSMTLPERRNIIMQLLRAYGYLHSKNIYHRDISPKNVLIKQYDDTLVVKLSDFGLVKIVDSDLTSENTEIKGSLNDPALKTEGFENYGLIHELYAITLLFTYVMTGKTNWAKINDSIIKPFMNKGTNPDKSKRFQTLEELGDAVKACLVSLERLQQF